MADAIARLSTRQPLKLQHVHAHTTYYTSTCFTCVVALLHINLIHVPAPWRFFFFFLGGGGSTTRTNTHEHVGAVHRVQTGTDLLLARTASYSGPHSMPFDLACCS